MKKLQNSLYQMMFLSRTYIMICEKYYEVSGLGLILEYFMTKLFCVFFLRFILNIYFFKQAKLIFKCMKFVIRK